MTTFLGEQVTVGDVVTKLAGQPIHSRDDLLRVAAAIEPTAPVDVEYVRGDQRLKATLRPTTRAIA